MLNSSYFYHRSIRKLVVAFGSIFNDIEIVRFTDTGKLKERFKVILSYGHKEKYIRRITSDPDLNKSIATIVPRIAFTLEDIRYDISRKQISSTLSFYPRLQVQLELLHNMHQFLIILILLSLSTQEI